MDNKYMLSKGDQVVLAGRIFSSKLNRFDFDYTIKKEMIAFARQNRGKIFNVKDVFGNFILLENNILIYEDFILPVDYKVVLSERNNSIKIDFNENNIDDSKFRNGFGYSIFNGIIFKPATDVLRKQSKSFTIPIKFYEEKSDIKKMVKEVI